MGSKRSIRELLKHCELCPRLCGVDRTIGEPGYCGLDERAYFFREMLHPYEEKILSPSHQLYMAGCNLRCGYCSVAEWNEDPMNVPQLSLQEVAGSIERRRREGAKNLNLLGGEPAVSLEGVLNLLGSLSFTPAVVWNSNMYYMPAIHPVLEEVVDIYLADFKCFSPDCCERLLDAADYSEHARVNILHAAQTADIIVRHLVIPGHFDCCTQPILDWLAAEMDNVKVSLRYDYIPPSGESQCPGEYLLDVEKQYVSEYAAQIGLRLIN